VNEDVTRVRLYYDERKRKTRDSLTYNFGEKPRGISSIRVKFYYKGEKNKSYK
jgi:hypothetical protein